MTNLQGINRKNKHCVQYPDIPSAIRPVPHGPSLPVPKPDVAIRSSSESESENTYNRTAGVEYWSEENDRPVPLTQADLNDLPRDLNLSKESSQLLGSRLREKNLLAPEHFTGIESVNENSDSSSQPRETYHWFTTTTLLI